MEDAGRPQFGALLRQLRADAGMTQQDLAERANLSIEAIGTLERGTRTRPHRDTIALLAHALQLSPERAALLQRSVGVAHPSRHREQRLDVPMLHLVHPDSRTARHNLPRQLTSFVARERECADIVALLDKHSLVTVVGSGGVGKTRVALQVASGGLDRYPDGVCLVDLAPLADQALVAEEMLSALRLPSTSQAALEVVVAYLQKRSALLLLDNCEHVVGAVGEVTARIVRSCPGVRILATSRQALGVGGEQVYRLPSLGVPPASSKDARSSRSYGAVHLFVDRARAVDAGFALTDDNASAVAEICQRLDGIPLAIELAAARIMVLAPHQIAERLDQRFRLLSDVTPRALPRHRTMTALLDWSYDLLTEREQRFFESLSVFASGCTLEAATAVCADEGEDDLDVLDLITSLITKSLVLSELSNDERRYRLLESTRQYAAAKLNLRGAQDEIARRHARNYLEFAKSLEASLDSLSDREWLALVEAERENCRAALEWSLGRERDVILGQRLAAACQPIGNGPALAEERWVARALELADERTPPDVAADLELADAAGWAARSEVQRCLAAAERALHDYRELNDDFRIAEAQLLAAGPLLIMQKIDEGEALLRAALETARRLCKRRLTARVLRRLSGARELHGDFAAARAYGGEALDLAKAIGADLLVADVLGSLASTEYDAGDLETGVRFTHDAVTSYRALSLRAAPGLTMKLAQLSHFLVRLGRYEEARVHAAEALELGRSLRNPAGVALALQALAIAFVLTSRTAHTAAAMSSATKLCGFADDRLTALSIPKIYGLWDEYGRALNVLRDALGAEEVSRLTALAGEMTEDEAIEETRQLTSAIPE